jgi:hypothetical protein
MRLLNSALREFSMLQGSKRNLHSRQDYWSQAKKQAVQTTLQSSNKISVDSLNPKNEYSVNCNALHPSGMSIAVG